MAELKDELRVFLTRALPQFGRDKIEYMFKLGFHSAENIINADAAELTSIPEVDMELAETLQDTCEDALEERAKGTLWGGKSREQAVAELNFGQEVPEGDDEVGIPEEEI